MSQHVVPANARDPYRVISRVNTNARRLVTNQRRGVWVPAFAGTTPGFAYPRPTNGILLAMTVMNSTLASSGRLAM
jgi:hypothetical protein